MAPLYKHWTWLPLRLPLRSSYTFLINNVTCNNTASPSCVGLACHTVAVGFLCCEMEPQILTWCQAAQMAAFSHASHHDSLLHPPPATVSRVHASRWSIIALGSKTGSYTKSCLLCFCETRFYSRYFVLFLQLQRMINDLLLLLFMWCNGPNWQAAWVQILALPHATWNHDDRWISPTKLSKCG